MDDRVQTLEGATLPAGLSDLPEPPRRVFVVGELPRGPRVAIVGTRRPSSEAEQYAWQLAHNLATRGVAVISGGAEGIDAAAHQGALAAGGKTVVVAPSSWELPYPKEHAELYRLIVACGGAHLTSFERGVVARRHQFFERNSLLVALSHALVIVEAPVRSGARNAANWARKLGRPWFVVPSSPWHAQGLGGIQELHLGARPLSSPSDLMRCLERQNLHPLSSAPRCGPGSELDYRREQPQSPAPKVPPTPHPSSEPNIWQPSAPAVHTQKPAGSQPRSRTRKRRGASPSPQALSGHELLILDALARGPLHPDDLSAQTQLPPSELSHALLTLTLKGAVSQSPDGRVTSTRR